MPGNSPHRPPLGPRYNLVGNSAKFTNKGHIILRATCPDNRTLNVVVEDTGRGIPEEKRTKLFSFGQQVDAADSAGGYDYTL